MHPWSMRAEGEVVEFPSKGVEAWARFDEFFEVEHERLFKALYFVTGNRHDAEELIQDAFLKLWERWGSFIGSMTPRRTPSASP
jgi:DNA-directed RNA polymerase specialized sigma24 family protein